MVLLLSCLPSVVLSDPVPDPIFSTTEPWDTYGQAFVAPGEQSPVDEVTVTVVDMAENPIPNAFVEIRFEGCSDICIDPIAENGLYGWTDEDGIAVLNPHVGGCDDCEVRVLANGMCISAYSFMTSTDWNSDEANGIISLEDFAFFATAFLGTQNLCADYNGNGVVGPEDFAMFAVSFKAFDANEAGCQ
jgi:hypothetical protein